jgi:hypothetical protein
MGRSEKAARSRTAMPVYRLVPLEPDDPEWRASAHRGAAVVRARDEDEARRLASRAFARRVARQEGDVVLGSLWRQPYAVKAEPLGDGPYAAEGPAAILEPRAQPS